MFIMTLFVFGQQVYCYVYLTILTLLGPFAFALAIIPSFSHSIASWVARYVQVAFWIPVGQLVMYINVYLVNNLMDAFGQAYQLGQQWVIVAMSIVAILNISAVPKISAYIIESTGANDAHSSSFGGIYKYFKGDPTSNDALTKIGGGLLVAVIILQVINYTML